MKKVKIVHAADLHFDTPFNDMDEEQRNRNKEELREVFSSIVSFCKEKSVDILLLAGDIFDNLTLSKETLYFIENTLGLIENTRVFISPGNHDPYGSKSFYKLVNWPKNVHIFKENLEKVYIKELDTNVWGAGFSNKYINKSIIKDFSYYGNEINIMVLHGELSSLEDGNEYNPITTSQIAQSNMDYIALGHRHSFSGIMKEGKTYYAYSGCPQGRGFDETGDKGIIYGYVSKGVVDLNFIKTSKRNYEEVIVDITGCFNYDSVKEKILSNIDESKRKNNLYKIVLKGEVSEEFNIDENILKMKIENDFYYCKVIDKTSISLNLEEILKGYSVKSIFINKLISKLNETEDEYEKEIIKMAIKIGISSLLEDEVNMGDY